MAIALSICSCAARAVRDQKPVRLFLVLVSSALRGGHVGGNLMAGKSQAMTACAHGMCAGEDLRGLHEVGCRHAAAGCGGAGAHGPHGGGCSLQARRGRQPRPCAPQPAVQGAARALPIPLACLCPTGNPMQTRQPVPYMDKLHYLGLPSMALLIFKSTAFFYEN